LLISYFLNNDFLCFQAIADDLLAKTAALSLQEEGGSDEGDQEVPEVDKEEMSKGKYKIIK
jgi:hypothetical protein